jgi:hypothetical protein
MGEIVEEKIVVLMLGDVDDVAKTGAIGIVEAVIGKVAMVRWCFIDPRSFVEESLVYKDNLMTTEDHVLPGATVYLRPKGAGRLSRGYGIGRGAAATVVRSPYWYHYGQEVHIDVVWTNKGASQMDGSYPACDFVGVLDLEVGGEPPSNNDGRETCFDPSCGAPTRVLDVGFGAREMRICTRCGK